MGNYRLTILFAICAMLFIATATLIVNKVFIHPEIDGLRASVEGIQNQADLRGDFETVKGDILRATVVTMGGLFLALLSFVILADVVINRGSRRELKLVERQLAERKKWEEELFQSQKMECIGRLAGGVAHDFNNLLTPIIGYAELTEMELQQDEELRSNMAQIRRAAEKATQLTRQLLSFSRRKMIESEVMELNHLVLDVGQMLQRLIGEDVELEIHPHAETGFVKAEPGQLDQVLVNMVVNGRDAMPEGGCILIETSAVTLDESFSDHHNDVVPGRYALLSVSDTGEGMSEEVISHIFEPFFTTKAVGKGTGLGLSTCYGIVKQCGGYLTVHSELGRGTTFNVYLPQVAKVDPEPEPVELESQPLPRGEETVLLAEDEPSVRELTSLMLRRQGYNVMEAANGIEALELAEEHSSDNIHLLLTDVIMPHMGGKELAEQLQTIHPETRVLYTSGYTDETILNQGLAGEGIQFIQKPFSPPELTRKVREVLDRRRRWIGPLGLPLDPDLPLPEAFQSGRMV